MPGREEKEGEAECIVSRQYGWFGEAGATGYWALQKPKVLQECQILASDVQALEERMDDGGIVQRVADEFQPGNGQADTESAPFLGQLLGSLSCNPDCKFLALNHPLLPSELNIQEPADGSRRDSQHESSLPYQASAAHSGCL